MGSARYFNSTFATTFTTGMIFHTILPWSIKFINAPITVTTMSILTTEIYTKIFKL